MILTMISILTLLAVFVVPALLALHHGVDTRTESWNTTRSATGGSTADPIFGTRR